MTRTRQVCFAAGVVLVAVGIAWFGGRYWRNHQLMVAVRPGVPAIPDLRRWPGEFGDRLRAATTGVERGTQPVQSLGELARLYWANEFTAEAETALTVLRRLEPADAHWAWYLGLARLQRGDAPAAQEQFHEVVRLAPDFSPAWRQIARFEASAGRHEAAQAGFARVVALIPEDPEANLALASIERLRGDSTTAIRRLETLAKNSPRSIEVHQQLAEIFENLNRPADAVVQRRLIERSVATPQARDPWMEELLLSSYDAFRLATIGGLLLEDGHPKDSLPYLRKAADLAPNDSTIVVRLADNYRQLGDHDTARSIMEHAIKRSPDETPLYIGLGDLLTREGRAAAAVALLQRRVVQTPTDADLQAALGQALVGEKNFAAATAAFREALRLNPTLTVAELNLGRCLLQTGQRAEGRAAVSRALAMRPEYADALLLQARLALEDRDYDAADRQAEKLLALAPADLVVLEFYALTKFTIASLLADAGRPVESEQMFRAGLAINPGYGRLHGGLGLLLGKQGHLAEQLVEMRRYVELAPGDAVAYLLLGGTYEAMQQQAEARDAYQRGLAVARLAGDQTRISQFEQRLAR